MIERIGTSTSGHPLVLAGLDETEQEALTRILALAEAHLDDIPYPRVRSRRATAELMIADLRARFGLRAVPAAQPEAPGLTLPALEPGVYTLTVTEAGEPGVTEHGPGCCCKNCPWEGNHGERQ